MRRILAAAAIAAASLAALFAGSARAGGLPGPDSNVNTFGKPFCQVNGYVRTNTVPRFTIHDSRGTCIEVGSPLKAEFRVASNTGESHWTYPNISAGFSLGHSSCPTGTDMNDGQCLAIPSQVDDLELAGTTRSWLSPDFKGNLSWDLFFTPRPDENTYSQMVHGGTEVMIWQAHPGIGVGGVYAGNPVLHARIGNRDWQVLWATTAQHGWNYVAFVAPRTATGTVTMHNVDINELLRYVISRMHLLSGSWYWQAADFGMEIYSGGAGSAVESYSLHNLWQVSGRLMK